MSSFDPFWKSALEKGLDEDDWQQDWTTLGALGSAQRRQATARVIAKSDCVWAAHDLGAAAEAVAREMGFTLKIKMRKKDGAKLKKGDVICEWRGEARVILALERPFLNIAAYVSGVATQTARLVGRVGAKKLKHPPRVTATRKTLPGYRDLSVHGVLAGGGYSHRVSLSGGVLIKENHIRLAGGVAKSVKGVLRLKPHGLRLETEVSSIKELREAVKAGSDALLLDNFTPELVRVALKEVAKTKPRPVIEVSGGITEENIASYAIEGVDIISTGSITHSVKSADLSLLVK